MIPHITPTRAEVQARKKAAADTVLRDQFAVAALPLAMKRTELELGLYRGGFGDDLESEKSYYDNAAITSYMIADAMMKAREQ